MTKLRSVLAWILATLCFLAPLTPIASAEELLPVTASTSSLDFSSENEYMLQAVVSPADLLSLILGTSSTPSSAERSYLNTYFSDYLIYDAFLPPTLLATEKDGDRVTVTALSYSYEGNNGKTVTYCPVRAMIGTRELPLTPSADGYSATFSDLTDADPAITVFYQGSLSLPKESVRRLVTMAYEDAQHGLAAKHRLEAYQTAFEEYERYLAAMEEYEEDSLRYEQYLSSLELYRAALAEYEQNQRDWALYREKEAAYNTYLSDCTVYEAKKEQFDIDWANYLVQKSKRDAYLTNLKDVRMALYAMESLFLTPTDKKTGTLYRALQNSELVVMFEKYQDVLSTNFNVPKKTITDLRADADRLNDLLGKYNDARNVSEKRAFETYKENYEEICTLFNSLYHRMSSILKPAVYTLMCAKLELEYPEDHGKYKKWRIKNVLAHIYLICLCLDDERTPDNTWRFYADDGKEHTYYFSDLLNQNLIISDSDKADPSELSWIDEVAEPTAPTLPIEPPLVKKPLPPATIARPTEPEEVPCPVEPTTVANPTPPAESDHALFARTESLREALAQGNLSQRTAPTEDVTLPLPELAVERNLEGVSVLGAKGRLLPVTDLSALPTPSEDKENLPPHFQTDYAIYVFEGWSEPIRLPGDAENLYVFAKYRRTTKTYLATFIIDGEVICEKQVAVGEIPTFDGSTEKASTNTRDYEFTTWNPPLSPIYADTEYVAQYRESVRTYTITFAMTNQTVTRRYQWQQTPTPPIPPSSYYSEGSLFEFIGWDKEIAPVTENTTYTACYREIALAQIPVGSDGSFSITQSAASVLLTTSSNRMELSMLVEKTIQDEKRLDIVFSEHGASLSLDTETLRTLRQKGFCEIFLDQDEIRGTAIRFFTRNNTELSLYSGELRLRLSHGFATEKGLYLSAYYPSLDTTQTDVDCTVTEQTVEFLATPSVYYKPYRRFTLTLKVGEHGQATANATVYSAEEEILLTILPDANYRLASLTFTDPVSGEVLTADPEALVMPAYDAELSVTFEPIEYTVQFHYHGETITQKQPFGATVKFPEIPTSFEEDGRFYTFIGWSSTASIVTGDMTYTANYHSIPVEEVSDSGEGGAVKAAIINVLLPMALVALLVLALLIVTPILIVKYVKKRKQTK